MSINRTQDNGCNIFNALYDIILYFIVLYDINFSLLFILIPGF